MRMQDCLAALALAGLVTTSALPAAATIIPVTTTTDGNTADGNCSLREAVLAANNNVPVDMCPAGQNDQTDTITVPAGTYTLKLTGLDNENALLGDLDLLGNAAATDLVITGAGAATTIIQACEVEQKNGSCPAGMGVAERVFHVIDAEVAMSGLTVRHGRDASGGHGIRLQKISGAAGLTLTGCVVTANGLADTGASEAGGIGNFGGTLTLVDSTVSDNVTRARGGGILNFGATAVLSLTGSTVSGNRTIGGSGGGIANEQAGAVTLTNSTISGNETGFFGGGIYHSSGTLALRSSTITANVVADSGQRGTGLFLTGPVILPRPTLRSRA